MFSKAIQTHRTQIALAALMALALFAAAYVITTASAAPRTFQNSFGTFTTPAPQALTVDQSNGDVYAVAPTGGGNTVHRFTSTGAPKNFTAGPDAGTNTLTGFDFGSPQSAQVAVDNSPGPANGRIYVADTGASLTNTPAIKVFAPDGTPLTTITGTDNPDAAFLQPCGVAVDQSNGDLYIGDNDNLWRYTPAGATVAEADYSGGVVADGIRCNLAVANGSVYAARNNGAGDLEEFAIADFATGPPPTPTPTVLVAGVARTVATDPTNGDVYVNRGSSIAVFDPNGEAPYYTFGSSADFGTTSAGVAVMGGGGLAYVSDRRAGQNHIDVFALPSDDHLLTVVNEGPGTGTVTSDPAGIDCGAACVAPFADDSEVTLTAAADSGSLFHHWTGCDATSANECTLTMDDEREVTATFSAEPAVSGTQASEVSASSALLKAEVNPNREATTYHFEYGDQGPCDANPCTATNTQSAGAGTVAVPVSKSITGLDPGTTYDFRLVASNAAGSTEGPNLSFTTYDTPPVFDDPCPNDAFRTGPSADLPDCRAYEQATPTNKGGQDAQGSNQTVRASSEGDAVTFFVPGGMPGGVGSQNYPSYIARRDAASWSSHGLLPPPSFGAIGRVLGWTSDLEYVFDQAGPTAADQGLVSRRTSDDSYEELYPPAVGTLQGFRFEGGSADNSKLYFSVGEALSEGGAATSPNLYVFDRETDTVALAGVLPDSACATPPCVPASGSFAGSYNWWGGTVGGKTLLKGGADQSFFIDEQHAVTDEGDAYFTAGATGQIYLRKDASEPGASTDHVNASEAAVPDPTGTQPAVFHTATPDGSRAFLTSSEALTDDANTGPAPPAANIGRAELDNAPSPLDGVDHDFLPQTAVGIAVDSTHLYWADAATDAIGRAELDANDDVVPGSVDLDFIPGADNPRGVAVEGSFVFWTNAADGSAGTGTIGRAELDTNRDLVAGSADQGFITGADDPEGIGVGGGHVFWGQGIDGDSVGTADGLGRANLDGTGEIFIQIGGGLSDGPVGAVAVTADHVYYAEETQGIIYRRDHDGTFASQQSGGSSDVSIRIRGLAVDGVRGYYSGHYVPGSSFQEDFVSSFSINTDPGCASCLWSTDPEADFFTNLVDPEGTTFGVAVTADHLFWSINGEPAPKQGNDLYRYDADDGELTDLTPLATELNGADVQGVLGASEDGDRIYFAANGDLDDTGPATSGDCEQGGNGQFSYSGTCSLYLAEDEDISLITPLAPSGGGNVSDAANWQPNAGVNSDSRYRTSYVSAEGDVLVFRSKLQLTAYDNQGVPQYYRYDLGQDAITCLTCNPTGAPPSNAPTLQSIAAILAAPGTSGAFNLRNASEDGNRFFFETTERLLANDSDGVGGCPTASNGGRACQDVYEWEAEGTGSCETATVNGGCLYLLTDGTSTNPSYFADASADGDDAFIFTRDRLVPQDRDDLVDIYDASVERGLAVQHATEPPGCLEDDCQGDPTPPPATPGSGSSTNTGPGNQGKDRSPATGTTTKKCSKKKTKKAKKCRKARRANTNRGGSQ